MCFFFFKDTATTEIYTLSLHDALPIYAGFDRKRDSRRLRHVEPGHQHVVTPGEIGRGGRVTHRRHDVPALAGEQLGDRKSTRLNSSHANISYAVFCLKKKKNNH